MAALKKRRVRIYGLYAIDAKRSQLGASNLSAEAHAYELYAFEECTSLIGIPNDVPHNFDSIEALAMWLIVADFKCSEATIGDVNCIGLSRADHEKLQNLLQ